MAGFKGQLLKILEVFLRISLRFAARRRQAEAPGRSSRRTRPRADLKLFVETYFEKFDENMKVILFQKYQEN